MHYFDVLFTYVKNTYGALKPMQKLRVQAPVLRVQDNKNKAKRCISTD